MQETPSRTRLICQLDPSRIFAAGLVILAHVVLLLAMQFAMSPTPPDDSTVGAESTLTVEFVAAQPVRPAAVQAASVRPPAARRAAARPRRAADMAEPTTSVEFLDAVPDVGSSLALPGVGPSASDVFDSPAPHRPFPREPVLTSDLPKSLIRLPGRPSMLQAYWAVPEGENLQGRIARKVPIVGLLLVATGAIGGPHCPPKSEHPDCLRRLIDGRPP